jgi:hypothetical protein
MKQLKFISVGFFLVAACATTGVKPPAPPLAQNPMCTSDLQCENLDCEDGAAICKQQICACPAPENFISEEFSGSCLNDQNSGDCD